jgi:hypothetical protein
MLMVREKEPKIRVSLEGIELWDIVFGLLLGMSLFISKYRVSRQRWKDEDEE